MKIGPGARRLLVPYVATRLGLLLAGWLAAHLLVSGLTVQKGNLVRPRREPAVVDLWARWDAEWYLLIAERGYGADDAFVGLPVAYRRGDDSGFFPLYPVLIRAFMSTGLPPAASGVLVSNLALLLALWLMRDLVRRDFGDTTADHAVILLLAFPTSFFLSAVYAESVMLASILGAVRLARDGRPALAGMAGALAALSRPTGILVVVPLLVETLRSGSFGGGAPIDAGLRRARAAVALVLPPCLAVLGYMLYCRSLYGSLAPFLARQERWRGPTGGPWRAFARYFESPELHGAHHSSVDFVVAALFVTSIPWLFRRLRLADAAYATAAILLPLGSTLWSFSRFAAAIYPVHVLLACWSSREEGRLGAVLGILLPLSGLFMALYAAWWWVG